LHSVATVELRDHDVDQSTWAISRPAPRQTSFVTHGVDEYSTHARDALEAAMRFVVREFTQ
jgi:hypothetical protein